MEPDKDAVAAIERAFTEKNLPYQECLTWSTDGFIRETMEMVNVRVEEGCKCVEMECSALCAIAEKRGASFGQFFFTADSLANVHDYDARTFCIDSHGKVLELAVDAVLGWK